MTINTLFMWDGVAPEQGSSSIQFPWKGDSDAAQAHMDEIAQLIKATNPDIVKIPNVLVQGETGGFEGPAAILGVSNLIQSIGTDEPEQKNNE